MIVTVKAALTAVAQVSQGDIIFNTGAVPVYVDTIQANVIQAPQSSATPVLPGQSIQWAGTPGLLYARDPTGSSPGIGVTSHTGLPFPAPVGGPQYLFRSYGLLLYNGTPGPGNLCGIFVAPNNPPVDDFGNTLAHVLRIGTNLNTGPHFGVDEVGDIFLQNGSIIIFFGQASNGGFYFYQGPTQTRVASISPDNNPDPQTNASIIPGIFAYGAPVFSGGLSPAVGLTASGVGPVILLFRAGGGHESGTHAALETAVSFPNAANEIITLTIQGPATIAPGDSIEMQFVSSPNNSAGANQAFARIGWLSGGAAFTQLEMWDAGGVTRNSVGGMSGGVPLSIISTTQHTANVNAFAPLTDSVNIPANDQFSAAAQTTYRFRFSATGTWPNPATVSGEFRVVAFGQSIDPFGGDNFSAGFLPAGASFWLYADISITVKTPGPIASGIGVVSGFVAFNNMTAVSSIATWVQLNASAAINTQFANPFSIQWGFNAAPNGGTITSIMNEFTRTENTV